MEYIVVLIILFIGLKYDKVSWSKSSLMWWMFEWLVLVLLAGLRFRVGGDTLGYMDDYLRMPSLSELEFSIDYFETGFYMPLWYYLIGLCKLVTEDYCFFQIIHAIITNSIIFWFFKKYSTRPFFAVLLYSFLFFLNYNTETLRQTLTMCCFLLAVPSLYDGRYLKYYLLIFFGLGFHHSAFFLFIVPPLFVLFKRMDSNKMFLILFVVIIGIIGVTRISSIADFINGSDVILGLDLVEKATGNHEEMDATLIGVVSLLIIRFFIPFCFLLCYKFNNNNEKAMFVLYVVLVGVSTPIIILYRILELFYIPFIVIMVNAYNQLLCKQQSNGSFVMVSDPKHNNSSNITSKRKVKNLQLQRMLVVLLLINTLFIRFSYYMTDQSVLNSGQKAYRYERYIPYYSVFNPQMDPKRERMRDNESAIANLGK